MRVGGHIEGSGTIGEFPFDVAEDGGTFIAEISSTGSISWLQTYDYLSGLDGMVTVGGVTTAFVTKTIGLMENELVLWTVTESEQATSSVQLGTKAYAEGLARDSAGNLWFGVLFQEAVTIPTGTFEHPRPSQFAQGTAFWRGIY
jgi:hypothetical protein